MSQERRLEMLRAELRREYQRYDSDKMSVREFEAWIQSMVNLQYAYATERSAAQLGAQAESLVKTKLKQGK